MKIDLQGVGKKIHGNTVLDNITISVESGKTYGFIGINGSGKTMLMRIICGLIRPTSGTILIDGKVLGKELSFPPSVGALIENPSFLPEYTAFQNLRFLAKLQNGVNDDAISDALQSVGLDVEDKRKYKKFSLGMKERLGIASAILGYPSLVILDEPTNALDENAVKMVGKIMRSLKSNGSLVISSIHDTSRLEKYSDQIFVIHEGKITKSYTPE